ncbi:MAG: M23 family metallopeptidase [Devosiaceae bacterium]|nr:M23 family metallopeptidase [Devosiaceae bacterium]
MQSKKTSFRLSGVPRQKKGNKSLASTLMIYVVFAVLVTSNIAMGLVLTMSDEISRLFQNSKDPVLLAYETKIMQLRMEVDRLNSRQYIQAGNLNLRLQELLRQQDILSEQYRFIQVLAQKSEELGGPALASILTQTTTQKATPVNMEFDPITTGSIFQRSSLEISTPDRFVSERENLAQSGIDDALMISQSLTNMMEQSQFIVANIANDARSSTDQIMQQLTPLGIAPELKSLNSFEEFDGMGVGGPLIPLPQNASVTDASSKTLINQVNTASIALDRLQQAKISLATAPIYYPLPQKGRISSPFGPRKDPFGNTRAFHSGIDYPAPRGTSITSVGAGTVLFAGINNGYGKFVEIDHGGGIITRYAHMSKILVRTGQQIGAGAPVGEVGSTGRSTGPHLHVEVRRDNVAVNPLNFFALEEKLGAFIQ